MTILYCDCFSGISGDMFLGALVDAGLPVETLAASLAQLGLPEFEDVRAERVTKGALAATKISFDLHDHESGAEPAGHSHQHEHQHEHRDLNAILGLIEAGGLPEPVRRTSTLIFQKLAAAEAKVHGVPVEQVHFHEVGAADSILDIVGAAVGLHYFEVQAVYSSALPMSSGQVMSQHGLLPLPAPATLELLRSAQARLVPSRAAAELVTPTGAAILAALAKFEQPAFTLERVGIGAGGRDLEWPNILRLLLGRPGMGV